MHNASSQVDRVNGASEENACTTKSRGMSTDRLAAWIVDVRQSRLALWMFSSCIAQGDDDVLQDNPGSL